MEDFKSKYTGSQIEQKLDSIKSIDTALSTTSTNPVTNKAITTEINKKVDKTALKDNDIKWGGPAIATRISPIAAAISSTHSANRFAFCDPSGITVEDCHNFGDDNEVWTIRNVPDALKTSVVSEINTNGISVLNTEGNTYPLVITDAMRITFAGLKMGVYCRILKFLLYVSKGVFNTKVKIERAKGTYATDGANSTMPAENGWEVFGDWDIGGWSGWNDIPTLSDSGVGFDFGGSTSQTTNYWFLRMTFYIDSVTSTTSQPSYYFFTVKNLYTISVENWTAPSQMARNGHLYSYNASQDAIFPAKVKATTLEGNLITPVDLVKSDAGTENVNRRVWFSDSGNEQKRAYDEDFKYNPSTNVLTVGSITGTAEKANKDSAGNTITATYATKTENNEKYTKPSSGIPKTDLASSVQTSLDKADDAVSQEYVDESLGDISDALDGILGSGEGIGVIQELRGEFTNVPDVSFDNIPEMNGQPMILFGAGTPADGRVPTNWHQFNPDTMEGYDWNGMPSASGQVYINTSVSSNGRYTAVPNGEYDLKWVNF